VAEYAIWRARQHNKRVIYTTPLKALSNQKYRDLCTLYGSEAVGLVTGDIVEHSKASIVIMTTEVYRNMLLEESGERFAEGKRLAPASLADVGYIVFDELHYLSDIGAAPSGRGNYLLAAECSAGGSLGDGQQCRGSGGLDQSCPQAHLAGVHTERAVPLEHYYFLDNTLHMVMNASGQRTERFPNVGGEARLSMAQSRGRRYTFGEDEEGQENGAKKRPRRLRTRAWRSERLRKRANAPNHIKTRSQARFSPRCVEPISCPRSTSCLDAKWWRKRL